MSHPRRRRDIAFLRPRVDGGDGRARGARRRGRGLVPRRAESALGSAERRPPRRRRAAPTGTGAARFQNYLKEQGHVVRRHAEVRARRGALVRQAVDLASSVVAKLPHGAPLEVVREAVLDDTGALRLRVKTRRPWAGAAVDGWVSAVSAKGTELVATTDAHPPPDDPLGRARRRRSLASASTEYHGRGVAATRLHETSPQDPRTRRTAPPRSGTSSSRSSRGPRSSARARARSTWRAEVGCCPTRSR